MHGKDKPNSGGMPTNTGRSNAGAGGEGQDPFTVMMTRLDTLASGLSADISLLRTEVQKMDESHTISVNSCKEEIKNLSDNVKNNFEKCNKDINSLKLENIKLKREIISLKLEVNDSLQMSKYNALKISNMPATEDENLMSIFRQICQTIDFPFNQDRILSCYRVKNKAAHGPIFVKFISEIDKETFIRKKKEKHILLTTQIFSLTPVVPIFINEVMSPYNYNIYKQLKINQTKYNIKYVWFKKGKLFVRISDDAPQKIIRSQEDASKLIKVLNEQMVMDYSGDEGTGTDTNSDVSNSRKRNRRGLRQTSHHGLSDSFLHQGTQQ